MHEQFVFFIVLHREPAVTVNRPKQRKRCHQKLRWGLAVQWYDIIG